MNASGKRVGRPPGPHDDTLTKLLPVALRLFLDEGGAALTPTRLHNETGVARATIYRNWPEPEDLIEIMLSYATDQRGETPHSGELRRDLHAAIDTLLDRFEQKPVRVFFAACLEYGRHSSQVADAAEAFINGILEPIHTVVNQALDSGDLTGDAHDLVADVAGPLIFQHVILGRYIQRDRARGVVDVFVDTHTR